MEIIPFKARKKEFNSYKPPFEKLYADYYSKVLVYLMKKTGNKEAAEDLTSEAFLYSYEHYDAYDSERSSLSTWLYIIVNSRLKNYYRDKKQNIDLSELENILFDTPLDLDHAVFLEQLRSNLAKALKKLPERQCQIITMRYFDNLEYEDIARELSLSPGNVRVILSRALEKLHQECLNEGITFEL